MREKGLKQKTCPVCRIKFEPSKPFQKCCDWECALVHSRMKRVKEEVIKDLADRKELKAKKEANKKKPELVKELGVAFRAWVRARDEGKPCISCDKPLLRLGRLGGDYDAGHYRSVGSAKHLEFDERNVFGQCKYCNDKLKGNPHGYRPRLIDRIGIEEVEALESDQTPRKYSNDDLRSMKALYIAKLKSLKQGT